MTPDTVHLFAQLIRHHRAMVNSFEQWVQRQPPSQTRRELDIVIKTVRGILSSYEAQLSAVQCDEPASRQVRRIS